MDLRPLRPKLSLEEEGGWQRLIYLYIYITMTVAAVVASLVRDQAIDIQVVLGWDFKS